LRLGPSSGGAPLSRQAQAAANGHWAQRGARAVQTIAPSSMKAMLARAARFSSGGSRSAIAARSAAVVAGPASGLPSTARDTTRRTLVSTTG